MAERGFGVFESYQTKSLTLLLGGQLIGAHVKHVQLSGVR